MGDAPGADGGAVSLIRGAGAFRRDDNHARVDLREQGDQRRTGVHPGGCAAQATGARAGAAESGTGGVVLAFR